VHLPPPYLPHPDIVTSSASQFPRQRQGEEPDIVLRVFALTDVGHSRDHNEDAYLVADLEAVQPLEFESDDSLELCPGPHGTLFLVADGMGGAASGELASSMASTIVLEELSQKWSSSDEMSPEGFATALRDAATVANERIHQFARQNPEHRGMGTTATIAGLVHDVVYVAQVGDSRAYLVRDGKAIQLTKDQSLMQRLVEAGEMTPEQAEQSDRRNIILQALGPEAQITVDLTHQQLRRDDVLILCSDGLSGLVRAAEIARHASELSDMSALCRRLVDRANELGGPDNITVVAVRIEGNGMAASRADDRVGHNAYPFEGTLAEEPRSTRKSSWRSDPTPPFGIRSPTRESMKAELERIAAEEEDVVVSEPVEMPVLAERKERVAPYMFTLAVMAVSAALWTLWRFVR
jgi:PPM family protein phosphatase